jgi:hypothetical protein
MKTSLSIGSVCLVVLAACGLEGFFTNATRRAYDRPASIIRGTLGWDGATTAQLAVLDADGNALTDEAKKPFDVKVQGRRYEIRLPSSKWSFVRVQARAGNFWLRALVPYVGEESSVDGVDLDARGVTEAMIVEARISAAANAHLPGEPNAFAKLNPSAYVGDGVTNGTRTLIRAAMEGPTSWDAAGATFALRQMVERFLLRADVASPEADAFFIPAVLTTVSPGSTQLVVTNTAIDSSFLSLNGFDYDGDGLPESSPTKFNTKLAEAARLYQPGGCPDPDNVRVVFEVDFNQGTLDGNCIAVNRFKWVTDKPGKRMYFTGGVYDVGAIDHSPISGGDRPDIQRMLGNWVPNQVPMYDDGTNGDEVAGDNIWTITFDLPRTVRISYKYTWGFRGDNWTGTEEWPGNQRLLEVADVNSDLFVRRRDVFADEATNKDRSNLNNASGTGVIDWTTDLHGCGPETREKPFTVHSMCQCNVAWATPQALGPLTKACAAP